MLPADNRIAKREKDIHQARLLFEALEITRRQDDLAEVFVGAWKRGPSWRKAIEKGLGLMQDKHREAAVKTLQEALSSIGEELEEFAKD